MNGTTFVHTHTHTLSGCGKRSIKLKGGAANISRGNKINKIIHYAAKVGSHRQSNTMRTARKTLLFIMLILDVAVSVSHTIRPSFSFIRNPEWPHDSYNMKWNLLAYMQHTNMTNGAVQLQIGEYKQLD